MLLKFAGPISQENYEVVQAAMKQNPAAWKYASPTLQNHPDLVRQWPCCSLPPSHQAES